MACEYSGSDNELEGAPPDALDLEDATSDNPLPESSKARYETAHQKFMDWQKENNIETSFSEKILLAYFEHISAEFKPSTLWATYSMLRRTIDINYNVNISNYSKLKLFLKRQSDGFSSKKSNILSLPEINKFIEEAPDFKYILMKTILIIGICGACRKQELRNMKLKHVEDSGKILHVIVPDIKTKQQRSFIVSGTCYKICKKYLTLRQQVKDPSVQEFFLNYQKGKCTMQVVGLNNFGTVPKQVAEYLKLENPGAYTGHCFRRTSATILVGSKGDFITPLRAGTVGLPMIGDENSSVCDVDQMKFTEGTKRPQLDLEEYRMTSLEDVPRKMIRITSPLEEVGVSDGRRENVRLSAAILLRIEAKLDKGLEEIEDVKSRLSSLEEKFDAEFDQPQFTIKPDAYPIKSIQTFFELERNSFKRGREAQQKHLQMLGATDIKSFVYLAFKNSISDEVIKNHFTLHGTDSKHKLVGTEFLNMIYCAAKSCTYFEGPKCLSDFFPYVKEVVRITRQRVSKLPTRSAQSDDESTLDAFPEDQENEKNLNERNNCGTSDQNEFTFVKVEEEEIDIKPEFS